MQFTENSVGWTIILTLVFANQFLLVRGLGFLPGLEYWYDFESTTHVKDAATIYTAAKIAIIPMNTTDNQKSIQQPLHQLCRLMVEDYQLHITKFTQNGDNVENPDMDFSKCLLFDLTEDGEILTIYYEHMEHPAVLSAKKTILNLISAKLVISASQEEKGQRWAYGTTEMGHEGAHSAIYQAEPSGTTVNFVKTKTTKALDNAKHQHTKKIAVHRHSKVPQEFHIQDEFETVKDSKMTGPGVDPDFTMDLPVMGTESTSRMKLDRVMTADKYVMTQARKDVLLETNLEAGPEILFRYNLSEAEDRISSNLTCVLKYGDSRRAIPCFRVIVATVQRLTYEDLGSILISYNNTKGWIVMVDALGAAATEDSLFLLTTKVFMNERSTPKQLMHALIHLVQLDKCPPKLLINELRRRAFEEPWSFSDDHATNQVNDRTKLVVGAMVSMVIKCNQTWGEDVTRRLEDLVGVHDPFHHRQMRATMTQKERRVHLSLKSVHIYALGNAGQTSSYDYFVSYLNTTESHMQLRFSAVEAIANYEHPEAAQLLLQVALTDEEDNVRRNAIKTYKKHPHGGGDLKEFLDQKLYRYSNITNVQHQRMRRGIKDVLSAIWKGFEFKMATPGMDWQKIIGGSSLGASFGLIIKNELDIKISPLAGHLKVDVHDGAWTTMNIGILGIDFDIFKAELCFKGSIEYDLNILAEYSPDDLLALADIYNNYIKKIVDSVKDTIDNFKSLVETWKGYDISAIWVDFVDSVKALPLDVQNLRKVARKVLKHLEEYADLPPVYTLIKDLVTRVITLFNDIKTDVMTLYNAIVDTVSTTLPWGWDEIKTAFNDIVEAFKNILKGPKTALQNIGKGALRISAAVAAVLDAKEKIEEANIFDKENRPYWFDFTTIMGDLRNDTLQIKDAIDESLDWLKGGPNEEEKEAERYTGVDLKTMKRQALLEVWSIIQQDLLQGPLDQIKRFLDPFLQTYQFFVETVNNIKEGWRLLLEGYQQARAWLDMIFGAKLHKSFPRKYLESATCGEGFYESTGLNNYKHTGVDLEKPIGSTLVAPFNGYIYDSTESGKPQVTMDLDDIKNTQVIIDNVELNADMNRQQVGAGDVIGTVTNPRWCLDGHVHMSMRKTNVTGDYIDPSKYVERREMPIPEWIEECDHYILVWLGKTISSGVITKDPEVDDQTPKIANAPPSSELNVAEITQTTQKPSGRKKRAVFDNIVDKLANFTKSLGLPGFDKLKEVFSLNINKVTLSQALDYLDDFGLTGLKAKIIALLLKVENFLNEESCSNPKSLDDNELKAALTLRGKSTAGARQTLINRYLESESTCFGLQSHVTDNIYCSYHSDCLGLTCCLDLQFFIYRHALSAFVRYEPCIGSVVIGVGQWTKVIEISSGTTEGGTEPIVVDLTQLNMAQLVVTYKVKQEFTVLRVSLAVRWCSTQSEECLELVEIMKDAQLDVEKCVEDATATSTDLSLNTDSPTVKALLDTTIFDVIKLIEYSGVDEDEINALTTYLRDAFQAWLRKLIEDAIAQIFGDEFDLQDMCMKGYELSYGPYKVVIFKSPPITMIAGPVVVKFQMGVDGYYGADFSTTLCVLSMKAVARITPRIGSGVWGSLSASILVFAVELKLTGYLLTTSFPTKAEVEFNKFPLDVKARMDLQLIPLHIELHVIVKIEIDVFVGTITKVIFKKKLWSYTSPTINVNIFNLNNAEPDESPPAFDWYSKANCTNCDEGGRKKRQINEETPRCVVYQAVGRDYRDPAYVIEVAVGDDKSPVTMTYCVGTFIGGYDIVKDGELSGTTTVVGKMITGQPLYFKVTAKNNAGMAAYSQCQISTYDMTLPTGRAIPAFTSSSHPDILKVSVLLTEDSAITDTKISLGFGEESYGFQVLDWMDFTPQPDDDTTYIGSDPLTRFHNAKNGKLAWEPFYRESHDEPEVCAQACLAYPVSKCQGFNYDYDAGGLCELLDIVEGEVELQTSSVFYYYERRGIGKVASFDYQDLQIQHDSLVFFNVYVKNNLDYLSILSSEGVLIDLTTPEPGLIENASVDQTTAEPCTAYTPDSLHPRCATQTPINNYRYITDGPGSMCLFNGFEPLVDERFTRANQMAAGNWDGIHDYETGIAVYMWSVGTEPCGFDIHPHDDPHKHLTHESEWTHIGVAYPLDLPDGAYYVTIRALNKVEFGGPLALTVCHHVPLIVDNTPPIILGVGEASYDEQTWEITMATNASDDLSLIKSGEIGLGRSPRDTYILEWEDIEDYENISYVFRVPDGIPVWVKVRVTNNVDLKTNDHAPRALFVDLSDPIAGIIYFGNYSGYHRLYQWESDTTCVVWEGFNDPDSGISEYHIALGSDPGSEDVVPYVPLSYTEASYCFTGLSLEHNTYYYVSMIAFNGATDAKNVSATSQGILVDLTDPVSGSVKDGLSEEADIEYSSDPATIRASWEGFSDPESGLDTSRADVHRKLQGSGEATVVHQEHLDPNTEHEMELHHMHFYHGDEVHVSYSVTNGAGSDSEARSDGFTVDLTAPVMNSLVDGPDTNQDAEYTYLLSELTAAWDFEDAESGIVHYKFTAYSKVSGRTTVIYPAGGTHKELEPTVTTWKTDEPLTLTPGGFYYIRIAALNAAGLSAVFDSNGVIADPTAPTILYVRAGVGSGESEQVVDGYVWQNNQEGIQGSWKAVDSESGISEYSVSVGTSEGDESILAAKSVGTALDSFLEGLTLELTDPDTIEPVYYINVVAINGAGMASPVKSSSPIRVVKADQAGKVWDGPGLTLEEDKDSRSGHYSVTVQFSEFESELNGIAQYMWAVGTEPRLDDIKGFSDYGIVTTGTSTRGLGDAGKMQETVQLEQGVTYYCTVRAITGDGSALDSSSDGFTIDSTSPQVSLSVLGSTTDEDYTDVPVVYRQSGAVEIQPGFVDPESGISEVWLSVGSYRGGHDITEKRPISNNGILILDARSEGQPTYFSVTAQNNIGLTSSGLAPVLVVDQTEPQEGQLSCPLVINANDIMCSWSDTMDNESGIDKYLFGIGTAEGVDNIIGFSEISKYDTSTTISNNGEFVLTHNTVYYATLAVVNNVGLTTNVYSNPMRVDNTPPVSGWVIELQDFVDVDALSGDAYSGSIDGVKVNEDMDILCQRDITKVEMAWQQFTDDESGVDYYDVALGSTPGGTQIHDFVRVEGDSLRYTFYPVDLSGVRQVFASVRGVNTVGLFNVAVSKGVYISRHSSGLTPLSPMLVLDGKEVADINYQYDNDRLYAHWDLRGDPCPAESMSWTIHKFDGTQAALPQMVSIENTYAEEDGVTMHDGNSFFVELRVTNALGYSYSIHSDGVTIRLQPLLPGVVRDGQMIGVDLNFQPSIDTLSGNWGGFGSDRDSETSSDGISDIISEEIGAHQTVSYYEVALGTDRRYPSTRNDKHPFINVGLNKTWTFQHLELIPKTSYYYVTVRAYSLSTTMVEVTSNGIRVGYGGHIVALGEIHINDYTTTQEEVSFSWTDFEFVVPVLHYYIGIKSGSTNLEDVLDCSNMIEVDGNTIQVSANFSSMFDAYPIAGMGLNTFIQLANLSLAQGGSYTAVVVALDESGTCAMVSGEFGVDTTQPMEGRIGIGPDLNLAVLYVPSKEELTVWWEGYTDPESGLMKYDISLMLGSDCDNFDPRQMTTVVDSQSLAPTSTNFTYLELSLEIGEPYYIILEVTNNAGLSTQTVSRPIIVDIATPTSGRVIDGSIFQHDSVYHGDPTRFEGRILYLPDPSAEACPYRTYQMTSPESDWTHIVHKGMWTLPSGKIENTFFMDQQITYDSDGATITMENDITTDNRVLSGALYADADIAQGASYEFEIRAAGEMYAVTSGAVVGWNQGIMADFSSTITSGNEGEQEVIVNNGDANQFTVMAEALAGDTYPEEYAMQNQLEGNSFGFQIVKDQDGVYHVILWALTLNSSRTLDFPLDYDPTTDFHTYSLLVNDGENPDTENDWSVKLLIDSQYRGEIAGISAVGQEATVVLGLYNNHGLMDQTGDVFDAPKTSAKFRNFRFSASSEELCRYGSPFIGGDHPIVEFYAGIGSEAGLDDVVTFQQAAQPCIPCLHACDEKICDPDCDPLIVQLIEIILDGLQLEPAADIQIDNITLPASYYLSVKGITGSGKVALGTSNGFYLDITPPKIGEIYHIDLKWNDYEPSVYQGSNDTMGGYWEVIEDESQIQQYFWAIGTSRFGTDIQDFVDAGTNEYAFNDQLEGMLENNKTYYITITAVNEAGLSSTNSSNGITTMFEEPDVSATVTNVEGATPIGDPETSNVVESGSQNSLEITWEDPSPSEIETTYCSVGSTPDQNDIFPETPCGLNSSSSLSINSDGFGINDGVQGNLTDIRTRRKRSLNQLMLEPGRILYPRVRACNRGHNCDYLPMSVIVVKRTRDNLLAPSPSGKMTGRIVPDIPNGVESIEIATVLSQSSDHYLIIGSLSDVDFQEEYKTEATKLYKPYIVDPSVTIQYTSRSLEGRIVQYLEGGFYLTGTPDKSVTGPIQISVKYPASLFDRNSTDLGRPTLLTWCEVEEIWIDVSQSCSSEYLPSVDWDNNILTTYLCDVQPICSSNARDSSKRKKRQTDTNDGFSGPGSFIVTAATDGVINDPPIISTDTTYNIDEDVGTINFLIVAGDPDSDDFIFLLDPNSEHRGNATLESGGQASYKPCKDCFGTDEVLFLVREVRDDGVVALQTNGVMSITIAEINDNPVVVLVRDGEAFMGEVVMTMDELNVDPDQSLRLVLVSYDVDQDGLSFTIDGNKDGTLRLYGQPEPYNITNPDCTTAWSLRKGEWDSAIASILDQQGFTLPIPCGLEEAIEGKTLNWVATVVEYTPNRNFLGMDTVQVIGRDEHGLVSEIVKINIFVLANPCENNATCVGPSWDPDCMDTGRISGFENYTCGCSPGFSGSVCEQDIDECLSSPCPTNYTCVDQTNAYQCICRDGWPCSQTEETSDGDEGGLDGWMIGVIAGGIALLLVVVISILFCVYKCATMGSRGSDREPILYRQERASRLPSPRRDRGQKNLVDSNGRPLKVVASHWLTLPEESSGYHNSAYDRTGDDYYSNHRRGSPRELREEPGRRHLGIPRAHSDRSLSTAGGYVSHVVNPVKRWAPRHILEEGGLYSSSHRHESRLEVPHHANGRRNSPQSSRPRRSRSASDLNRHVDHYGYI